MAKGGRSRYRPGGESPGVLPHHLAVPLLVLELDVEHLRKVLAQAVRGGALDASPSGGNERLERHAHVYIHVCVCVYGNVQGLVVWRLVL